MVLEDRHRAGVGLPVGLRRRVADRGRRPRSRPRSPLSFCAPGARGGGRRRPAADALRTMADRDAATMQQRADAARRRRRMRCRCRSRRARRSAARSAAWCRVCSAIRRGDHGRQRTDVAPEEPSESLAEALQRVYPELEPVREAARDPVYLVGGAVRDLLLGRGRADLDLVVEGDAAALASRLGAEVVSHERFAHREGEPRRPRGRHRRRAHGELSAARGSAGGRARRRSRPTSRRRDFTINAMAIPLHGEPRLIDPHGGQADLAAGLLRVLHDALLRRRPDPGAARRPLRGPLRLRAGAGDRGAAARGRSQHGLRPTAAMPSCCASRARPRRRAAFALLAEWGLLELREGGVELVADGGRAARVAALGRVRAARPRASRRRARARAAGRRRSPRRARPALARRSRWRPRRDPVELALARALGAEWLDDYLAEWRDVGLEIDGDDLIAAGIPEGPAIGRGLDAALRRKLDGEIDGRERGAGGGARGGEERRWSGVRQTACAGSRPAARATAAFTTRLGGVSEPPFEASTSASSPTTSRGGGREPPPPRRALGSRPSEIVIGRQVHGAELRAHAGPQAPSPFADAGRPDPRSRRPRTAEPGLAALVFVADCLPVALCRPRRRGDAALRLARARGRDRRRGAAAVGATDAAIGPCDRPLLLRGRRRGARRLRRLGDGVAARPDARSARGRPARCCSRPGSSEIESAGLCTSCEPELFFSHRRDGGRTGRQAGLVWREAEAG